MRNEHFDKKTTKKSWHIFLLAFLLSFSVCRRPRRFRLASLVAHVGETVRRTGFFRRLSLLPPCSNPIKKNKDHEKFVTHLPLSFLAVFQRVSATPSPSPRFARCPRRRNQSAGLVSSAGLACSLLVRIPLKKIKTTKNS